MKQSAHEPLIFRLFPPLAHINVPNLITTLGFVLGVIACYYLLMGQLRIAIAYLFFAGVMDLVDGYFATKLNQQTAFGKHVDTLVDFFTCCIIPAVIVFGVLEFHPALLAGLLYYSVAGLWRLSSYNITQQSGFRGLPVPTAMMFVTFAMWFVVQHGWSHWVMVGVFLAMGPLMLCGLPLAKYGKWQVAAGLAGFAFFLWVMIFN